ncbi:MAG: phosphate signaling complex protein PhoU [Eggerthellaceae bacterium]|nr:phosphate signaling complex protein PhoU [Eggerthellaceae bacterium]
MPRARFDSQLEQLNEQLKDMAAATETALMAAVEVLSTRDQGKAREIIAGDDDIDTFERDIESLCLKLLLMQQPVVAGDLRRVGAALKMVGDLERIGDQAADIAEVVLTLDGGFDSALKSHLATMAGRASAMVHEAVGAYVNRDEERAHAVIGADDGVNELFERVKQDVIDGIKAETDPAANLVEAMMAAKYLERVGDHAQNIAEWVEYSITGLYKGKPLN